MNDLKKYVYKDCIKLMLIPIILNILSLIISGLSSIIISKYLGKFTDSLLMFNISYVKQDIIKILICLLFIVIIIPLFELFSNIIMFKFSLNHEKLLYGRFLNKTYEKILNIDVSEVEYRLKLDAIELRINLIIIISNCIIVPIVLLILLYSIFKINLLFGLSVFFIALIKIFYPYLFRKIEAKFDMENRNYETDIRKYEIEITSKPYILKFLNIQNNILKNINETFKNYFNNSFKKVTIYNTINDNIKEGLTIFSTIVILIIGAILTAKGKINAGDIVTMLAYISILEGVLLKIIFNLSKFKILDNICERILLLYTDFENCEGERLKTNLINSIVVKNLSFNYNEDKEVLKNISFEILEGDKCLILGQNGTGKSTLIKIITGLIKDYKGSIKINNIELKNINIKDWNNCFCCVEQLPYMFPTTVLENIRIGNLSATDEQVNQLIYKLNLEKIKHKVIDLENTNLSGGEKQRISMARALLKDSPIIIMDEPHNNLDKDSLEWLNKFINLTKDKILIFISHNEDIKDCANKIINLNK